MATMAERRVALNRQPIWLLKVTLDQCAEENAAAPCTAASGCYFTWNTCQDTTNYNKSSYSWQFSNRGVGPDSRISISAKSILRSALAALTFGSCSLAARSMRNGIPSTSNPSSIRVCVKHSRTRPWNRMTTELGIRRIRPTCSHAVLPGEGGMPFLLNL